MNELPMIALHRHGAYCPCGDLESRRPTTDGTKNRSSPREAYTSWCCSSWCPFRPRLKCLSTNTRNSFERASLALDPPRSPVSPTLIVLSTLTQQCPTALTAAAGVSARSGTSRRSLRSRRGRNTVLPPKPRRAAAMASSTPDFGVARDSVGSSTRPGWDARRASSDQRVAMRERARIHAAGLRHLRPPRAFIARVEIPRGQARARSAAACELRSGFDGAGPRVGGAQQR